MEAQKEALSVALQSLSDKTGYPIIQLHGQRKFGPPPGWNAPPPQRGCEVFIGKIPREMYEDVLVPVFSRIGLIYELRLMMDFSGSNRGYAFLTYTNRKDANKAVIELNGFEIMRGRFITVVKSLDNCRLYIGNIPPTKTKEDVLEELSKKVVCIVSVTLCKNSFVPDMNGIFALVKFSSHRAAAMARRALVGSVNMWDQEVIVFWAQPEPDVDDDKEIPKIDYSVLKDNNRQKYFILPSKLESICTRYKWATPKYQFRKYKDSAGKEFWTCAVELPYVGLPLLQAPRSIVLLMTRGCQSLHKAHVQAALNALQYLKAEADMLHRASPQPGYEESIQPDPSFSNILYDYKDTMSTIWGTYL